MGILERFTAHGQRERARASAPAGPLRDYYDVPLPPKGTPLSSLPMLALDVETTGLDASSDQIVSIGWVQIDDLAIKLGSARQILVKPSRDIGQSAVFHGITHDQLEEDGVPIAAALASTLAAVQGRIMVAHFAPIERQFLAHACSDLYGAPVKLPAIDTMRLQRHLLRRGATGATMSAPGALRLQPSRDRYHLPRYRAHDALLDAISAAELLLAQVAELSPDGSISSRALRKLN